MTKRYIIDKADIHDLLAGKELSLAQGRESAFCITISENMTNGDMIKAIFSDCEVCEHKVNTNSQGEIVVGYDVFLYAHHPSKLDMGLGIGINVFFDAMWWNAPYEAESEK